MANLMNMYEAIRLMIEGKEVIEVISSTKQRTLHCTLGDEGEQHNVLRFFDQDNNEIQNLSNVSGYYEKKKSILNNVEKELLSDIIDHFCDYPKFICKTYEDLTLVYVKDEKEYYIYLPLEILYKCEKFEDLKQFRNYTWEELMEDVD